MLKTEEERAKFCREYNISEGKFREARLTWEELEQIADDFEPKRDEHQSTVQRYADVLRLCKGVHSLSYRVKDTGHLLEKMIRKNPKYLKKGKALSKTNYEKEITDLMGIRKEKPYRSVHYVVQSEKGVGIEISRPFRRVRAEVL